MNVLLCSELWRDCREPFQKQKSQTLQLWDLSPSHLPTIMLFFLYFIPLAIMCIQPDFTRTNSTPVDYTLPVQPNNHPLRWSANHGPLHDAHAGLAVLDEAHAAIAVPLVLHRHAADLHHHLPQLLGRAPALFRTRELLAGGGQQLTQLTGEEVGWGGWKGVDESVIGGI